MSVFQWRNRRKKKVPQQNSKDKTQNEPDDGQTYQTEEEPQLSNSPAIEDDCDRDSEDDPKSEEIEGEESSETDFLNIMDSLSVGPSIEEDEQKTENAAEVRTPNLKFISSVSCKNLTKKVFL